MSGARHTRGRRQRALLLAAGVWTLAVALTAWWLVESRLHEYREQSLATSTVRLNAIKDTLAITLRQLGALPLNLAHRNSVLSFFDAPGKATGTRDAVKRDVDRELDRTAADFGLPLALLLDREGVIAATTGPGRNAPPNLDNNLSHREYFVDALAKGRAMQFLLGRATRQPGLYFANRIERDGVAVGVAVIKQDAETLNRLLKDPDGSRIFVSDSNGVVVLGGQPDMLLMRLPGAPPRAEALYQEVYQRTPAALPWQLSRIGLGGGRSQQVTTIDSLRHLTLSSPLGETPLTVWVLDPLDEEPQIARSIVLGAVGIWAAGALLIWVSWRRLQSLDEALQARREIFELTQALPLTVFRYHQPIRGPARFSFIGRGAEELFGVEPGALQRDPQLPWRLAGTGDHPPTRPLEFLVRRGSAGSPGNGNGDDGDVNNTWLLADSTLTLERDGGSTYNGYWLDVSLRRETEARFAAVFEHAPAGYVFFDAPHGISHANAACLRLFGCTDRHQLLGRHLWLQPLSPDEQPDGQRSLDRALADLRRHTQSGQRVQAFEWRFQRFDGSSFDADVGVIALEWEGTPQFCAVIQDITARNQAAAAMRHAREAAETASRTKSTFLANMSHELRTPMNAIIGMTHLALEDGLPEKQRDYIEKAHGSARNLLQILNDILDVSKIEAGQMVLERIDFELESVIGEMADVLGLKADEKSLELLFSASPDLPTRLVGDPSRLRQVLVNLGGNAIKFTDRGEVVIEMGVESLSDEHVVLHACVRDTGVGLSEEELGRLFQPFIQADSSTTRRFGGTGLGLVISRQLVERMGGKLWVDSTPGVGSAFHFTARFGRSTPRAPARVWMAHELRGTHALLVDDNAAALDVLGRMLDGLGVTVDKAESGEQALALVDAAPQRYDWFLLDWKMPGMDGVACAKRIVERHPALRPCILLVTAFARDDALRAASGLPLAGVLHKPVTPSSLHDCLLQARRRSVPAAAVAANRTMQPSALSEAVLQRLNGARILVVEDHPLNQQLATELLKRAGMEVVVAGDGREALARLADNGPFDGVLMDCQMPVMDGYDATRELRANPAWQRLPVIAMTASALAEDRDRALASGM
ncbi:MAG TPA: response regulator, partial [Burkholderiaceae bacterium]|nr:response regulator [Burkholderiaceae bacterium]